MYLVTYIDGAIAKLSRAYQHLAELDMATDATSWFDSNRLDLKPTAQVGKWVYSSPGAIRSFGVAERETRQKTDGRWQVLLPVEQTLDVHLGEQAPLPLTEWGAIVGDIVHDLHSALDNMVWGLSVYWQAKQGKPLPDPVLKWDDNWKRVSFPICLTKVQWEARKTTSLWAIPPSFLTAIECLQPWKTGKEFGRPPEREWPNVLHELWNGDKHHAPSFVATNVSLRSMNIPLVANENYFPQFTGKLISDPTFRVPLEDRAKVATVHIVCANPRAELVKMEMRVNVQLNIQVAFEDCPPAYGALVSRLLTHMCDSVAHLLIRAETALG